MTDKSDKEPSQTGLSDIEALSRNMALFVEEAGKATAAYLKPIERGEAKPVSDEMGEVVKALGQVAERWMSSPQRMIEAQASLASGFISLWGTTLKRLNGEDAPPVAEPDPRDKRFSDPEWTENPVFDFLKQAYLITTDWAENLVEGAEGIDEHTRQKARFYMRQIASALSPSNFLATNPELLRETLRENGANLVRGMHMLAEDLKAGKGSLKIRQTDPTKFEVGVNLATTPGKVVFRNELMELIQYAPTTETVLKRPLLIVPPWINKYYILDLTPDKSFIRWAVDQGLTVFCISWVNPDADLAEKGFEEYMREGIFAALDAIARNTGEKTIAAIGYCIGGTLLAMALGYMAEQGDKRIDSATFFTAQVDFSRAGDLRVFIDEEQVEAIEKEMCARGYLEGQRMASAFNMLRPNDLIWPYVVGVYLKGQIPQAFDLLHWNSDSTRMTVANHSFYLRQCYLENRLARGELILDGLKISLHKVTIPIYELATREDHIAPARSVFLGAKLFGGPVRFVVAGSGHIAGVINPPQRQKYQHWTNGAPLDGEFDDWLASAEEHPGSWWPDWFRWLEAQAPARVKPRDPAKGKLKALCDAPGTYVKVQS